jgi:Na+/melibiose symporter-like transporter
MLSGQISDGFATPIVGYFSDRTKTRFGARKPWYL